VGIPTTNRRAFHLNTRAIPTTRLAGLALVAALIPIHNASSLGHPDWRAAGEFATVAATYCLASWLILKRFFRETKMVQLGDLFLGIDILVLLFAIQLTGGPASWLFFLLAGRCVDQIALGFRRVIWFNHIMAGSYLLVIDGIAAHRGGLDWRMEAAKLGILYAFNWYCAVTARSVEMLRRRTKRADAARRAGAELSGTVAHAVRTRVNRITVGLDLLRQTALTNRQRDYADTIAQCSQDLMGLIRVLGAPSAESRESEIQNAPFSPAKLLVEVDAIMRPFAEAKGISLRIEAAETERALGDAGKIRHVLLSLTDNAVKFTELGFVELSVRSVAPGRLAFRVSDSGPGIPAHIQWSMSAHRNYRGPRAGLAISQRLVELMGGTLEVHTDPSHGSTLRFILDLPACAASDITGGRPDSLQLLP
jgi:signal transduction histidine kinase